ncbi:hypothetical protein [Paenibacillus sinopodophylli]|uniref:hypothetical protein n=1 Tax=Paenibacillus sinopodophylli TaxID=1837342 RepID=UPI00110CDA70|nr:hypothetical protein [Paenibacillus sinopodophylli]
MIKNIIFVLSIHVMAWMLIPVAMLAEPFSWFLNPIVNNTPAFVTVSRWLAQSLLITNIIGFCMYKLRFNPRLSIKDWRVAAILLVASLTHLTVVSVVIFLLVGYEGL